MTAVEALGQTQHGGQRANRSAAFPAKIGEPLVLPVRRRLTMIPGDERHRVDFVWLETAQIAVLDQVVGVLVVPLVGNVDANVVKERRVFEPLALAIGERVDAPRLIEECDRQARHLRRVLR